MLFALEIVVGPEDEFIWLAGRGTERIAEVIEMLECIRVGDVVLSQEADHVSAGHLGMSRGRAPFAMLVFLEDDVDQALVLFDKRLEQAGILA